MSDLLRECQSKLTRCLHIGSPVAYDPLLRVEVADTIAKIDAALAADALSAAQTYPDRRFEIAALEQKLPWPWTGSISKERYGDTPPEPKRLPTVAEMRGILSDENTNAAPQEAPAQESHTYVHGINKQPAVAAPVAAILATARASEAYREQGAEFDADAIRAGLEPRGCPTPGACSCPVASVQDALYDSAYLAGAKAGFSAAQAEDQNAALKRLRVGRDGYLKAITRVPLDARPSPQAAVAAPSPQDGRSQRDYFIAHAPASEIDNLMPSTVGELATWLGLTDEYDFSRDYVRCVAKARGIWADAMLAAAKESP